MGRISDARERLIESGISLLWQRSYSSVSVDDLCDAASVRKGSFYHYFESKDAFVLAALEAHWAGRRPILDGMFSASKPPLQRLNDYFAYILQRQRDLQAETGHVLGCFYFCLGNECTRNVAIAARVKEIVATYVRYYESAIREAQSLGLVPPADAAAKAQALFALMEGLLAQARIQNNVTPLIGLPQMALGFLGVGNSEPISQVVA